MRICCCSRHFCYDRHALLGIATKCMSHFAQAAAGRKFHAEVRKAFFAFAHLVDRKNIWMIEARGSFCFAAETLERFAGIGVIAQDAFHGNNAAGMPLTGTINNAHPTTPDLFQNFVITQAPFLVANVDSRQQRLERFSSADRARWVDTRVQKATYTKPTAKPRRRLAMWTS